MELSHLIRMLPSVPQFQGILRDLKRQVQTSQAVESRVNDLESTVQRLESQNHELKATVQDLETKIQNLIHLLRSRTNG